MKGNLRTCGGHADRKCGEKRVNKLFSELEEGMNQESEKSTTEKPLSTSEGSGSSKQEALKGEDYDAILKSLLDKSDEDTGSSDPKSVSLSFTIKTGLSKKEWETRLYHNLRLKISHKQHTERISPLSFQSKTGAIKKIKREKDVRPQEIIEIKGGKKEDASKTDGTYFKNAQKNNVVYRIDFFFHFSQIKTKV